MNDLMKTMKEQQRKAREVIALWPEGKRALLAEKTKNEPNRYIFGYTF